MSVRTCPAPKSQAPASQTLNYLGRLPDELTEIIIVKLGPRLNALARADKQMLQICTPYLHNLDLDWCLQRPGLKHPELDLLLDHLAAPKCPIKDAHRAQRLLQIAERLSRLAQDPKALPAQTRMLEKMLAMSTRMHPDFQAPLLALIRAGPLRPHHESKLHRSITLAMEGIGKHDPALADAVHFADLTFKMSDCASVDAWRAHLGKLPQAPHIARWLWPIVLAACGALAWSELRQDLLHLVRNAPDRASAMKALVHSFGAGMSSKAFAVATMADPDAPQTVCKSLLQLGEPLQPWELTEILADFELLEHIFHLAGGRVRQKALEKMLESLPANAMEAFKRSVRNFGKAADEEFCTDIFLVGLQCLQKPVTKSHKSIPNTRWVHALAMLECVLDLLCRSGSLQLRMDLYQSIYQQASLAPPELACSVVGKLADTAHHGQPETHALILKLIFTMEHARQQGMLVSLARNLLSNPGKSRVKPVLKRLLAGSGSLSIPASTMLLAIVPGPDEDHTPRIWRALLEYLVPLGAKQGKDFQATLLGKIIRSWQWLGAHDLPQADWNSPSHPSMLADRISWKCWKTLLGKLQNLEKAAQRELVLAMACKIHVVPKTYGVQARKRLRSVADKICAECRQEVDSTLT